MTTTTRVLFGGKREREREHELLAERVFLVFERVFVKTIMADDKDVAEKTIAEDLVVTKYKMAGEIVNSECQLLVDYGL